LERIGQIYERYPALTPKQQQIADFLLANPKVACFVSLKELSRLAGASEVSVLRTCTALGFEGFLQLKEAFRASATVGRGLPSPAVVLDSEGQEGGEKVRVLQEICNEESAHLADMLAQLDPSRLFDEARTLLGAGEVFVFGHDVSKVFADYIFHRLTFLRIKASSIRMGDSSTVQSMLARMQPGDHAIILSLPPYHLPAVTAAKYALRQGASATIITDSEASPALVEGCRHFLCNTSTRFFYNTHTLIMVLVNLLASCVAIEMGQDYKEILLAEQAVEGYMKADAAPAGLLEEDMDD